MGYARHIGRVGALAVTLGVGVALATTPGIAYAQTEGSSSGGAGTSTSSSTDTGASTTTSTDAAGTDGADGADGDDDASEAAGDEAAGDEAEDAEDEDGEDEDGDDADDGDEDAEDEDADDAAAEGDADQGSGTGDSAVQSAVQEEANQSASANNSTIADTTGNDGAAAAARQPASSDAEDAQDSAAFEASARSLRTSTADTNAGTATFAALSVPNEPAAQPPNLVTAVTEIVTGLVNAVLQPFLGTGPGSPIQIPILSAVLGALRDEMERNRLRTVAPVSSQQTISALDADDHVLVIGIDGANLSRILALSDTENANFRELMSTGVSSAPSIVGHTTLSNPSWTAILTGEWGEKTGVINNVYTPWTYDKFPTVFNQLEALPGEIDTMTVANWDVINAISASGPDPVDQNIYIEQISGDTNWLATDDKVAAWTIDAIEDPAAPPNFLFSYFVGVDENGHLYGGDSPEYKAALINMDDNLGQIMDAIDASGEEWTIIVVTDHGHVGPPTLGGRGHGFQSPDETATFVIANGAAFGDGVNAFFNPDYEIVDTTPTVVALFGGEPKPGSDGVTLMSLSGSEDGPFTYAELRDELEVQIASNQSPGLITSLALNLRTIFASIPYFIYDANLPFPIGDALYVVTNVPAQIVALLTGVQGADLVHLLPPPRPDFPPAGDPTLVASLSCGDSADAQACIAS